MRLSMVVLVSFSVGLAASSACAQTAQKITGEIVRFSAGLLEMRTTAGARETAAVTELTRCSLGPA